MSPLIQKLCLLAYLLQQQSLSVLSQCTQVQMNKNFERKIAIIFLSINFNICFGCSKERSHREGSFEYPQHMFWLRNNLFFSDTHSYLAACYRIPTKMVLRTNFANSFRKISLNLCAYQYKYKSFRHFTEKITGTPHKQQCVRSDCMTVQVDLTR